jgi:hypothetical protein
MSNPHQQWFLLLGYTMTCLLLNMELSRMAMLLDHGFYDHVVSMDCHIRMRVSTWPCGLWKDI